MCCHFFSPNRKERRYSEKIQDLYNIPPRSSIYFLSRCSKFCESLKKNSSLCFSNQVSGRSDLRVGRKMATFQLFFSAQGTGGNPTGQIRRIGWVIKILEAQVGQFLLGCKCPVRQGIVVQEQEPLMNFPRSFSFKISFN